MRTPATDTSASGLAVEHDPDRYRPLFIAFVTIGILLATVLGIREVVLEPVVQLDEVRSSDREEPPVQAQVLALNTSDDTTYCVEVTITAVDLDGQTLLEVVADPTSTDGSLPPGRSANYVAMFDGLTEQELDEELDDFLAFVTASDEC